MDVKTDQFVHFTPEERVPEILKSGRLLFHPPYEKFGIEDVAAVSVVWGKFVPGVQTTHIGKSHKLGAILFETRTIPKIGYSEEVLWNRDVVFTRAKGISADQAKSKILTAPLSHMINSSDHVMYLK